MQKNRGHRLYFLYHAEKRGVNPGLSLSLTEPIAGYNSLWYEEGFSSTA